VKEEFNYVIARYWGDEDGQLGAYCYFSEVHYGTLKDAENFLEYVLEKSENKDWKIFPIGKPL